MAIRRNQVLLASISMNGQNVDIIHNLNIFPYPLEDESFDEIYIDNTLEHLDNVIGVMEEVHHWLICKKPFGEVNI
jgi:hypothetical protein